MADAKPTSSEGGGWGTFEIVLGIILLVSLLNYLTAGRSFINNNQAVTPIDTTPTKKILCGLSISKPKSGEYIGTTFNLTGKTDGCDWWSTEDTALFAQVIDRNGKSVSEFIKIPPLTFENGRATFNSTIGISTIPAKGIGYLILVPAQNDSLYAQENAITHRIPIKFK